MASAVQVRTHKKCSILSQASRRNAGVCEAAEQEMGKEDPGTSSGKELLTTTVHLPLGALQPEPPTPCNF